MPLLLIFYIMFSIYTNVYFPGWCLFLLLVDMCRIFVVCSEQFELTFVQL